VRDGSRAARNLAMSVELYPPATLRATEIVTPSWLQDGQIGRRSSWRRRELSGGRSAKRQLESCRGSERPRNPVAAQRIPGSSPIRFQFAGRRRGKGFTRRLSDPACSRYMRSRFLAMPASNQPEDSTTLDRRVQQSVAWKGTSAPTASSDKAAQ
jgi:hypothetical protein